MENASAALLFTVFVSNTPYQINGCDWPGTSQAAGNLSEAQGDQTHLPEKIKHELADLSGSQASSFYKQMLSHTHLVRYTLFPSFNPEVKCPIMMYEILTFI